MLSAGLKAFLAAFACLISVWVFISPLPVLAQGMVELWQRTYDSGRDDVGMGVAVDSHNNVIVTGYVMNVHGNNDFYTIKYDSTGNKIWDETYDSGRDDRAMDVAVDSLDNIIVTGWSYNISNNYDYYTIKYDSAGNKIWDETFDSGMDDDVFGVAIDRLDNVIITGHRRDGVGSAYNTVKYDKNGNFLWSRIYNPFGTCEAFDVAVDSQDNVIVTGQCGYPTGKYYTLWYDGDGNLLRVAIFGIPGYSDSEGKGVAVDSGDNVIVSGMSGVMVNREYQFIYRTVKYNKYGEELWVRDYGQPTSFPWRVAVDSHDNCVVTGSLNVAGNANYGTVKYDKSGNRIWVLSHTGGHADAAWSIAVDHVDNVIVTGGSKNASGNFDYCTIKYTAATPTIISFSPTAGSSGTIVTISGTNLLGATAVSFGGVAAASFTVDSDTQITAITANGTTGKITITTSSGTGASADNFNFDSRIGTTPRGSSMSGITAAPPQGPVSLPTVFVKRASLSATKVAPGAPITVTADVVNTGAVNGSSSIKVYINGELENSQGVTVNSGASTPITFTISRNEPGTYSVYVGGTQAGSFTVDQFADPNIILYISGSLLLFAFVIGLLLILRRKQPEH
jgi:hypothetical protein